MDDAGSNERRMVSCITRSPSATQLHLFVPHHDLTDQVDFDLLHHALACDVQESLETALSAGAALPGGASPMQIFRQAVLAAVRDIERHPRGRLMQRFVTIGPYPCKDAPSRAMTSKYLTDDETATAVRFVHSWMVSAFQGRLAELLTAGPASTFCRSLKANGALPESATLYAGDLILAVHKKSRRLMQAADLHVATIHEAAVGSPTIRIHLLGEIKSYVASNSSLRLQVAAHVERLRHGSVVRSPTPRRYSTEFDPDPPLTLLVLPASWRLPRAFRLDDSSGSTLLHLSEPTPPTDMAEVNRISHGAWRLTLRWSHEALAAASYALSFWYMEQIGAVVFGGANSIPWPEMTPEDAGCNAAIHALYYAILRARTRHEYDRAVALYNTYAFGYALGMSFRAASGERRMLRPADLRDILARGVTSDGSAFN